MSSVDKAISLLAKLYTLGFHPSFVSYAYLIEALGSVGRTLEADCLFQEMRGFGLKPRTKLYNVLLRGCLKKGLLGVSMRVLAVMDGPGIPRNRETYEILLDYYVSAGRMEDTWSVINEMKRRQFRLSSFVCGKVIGLYQDNGMWKKAMDVVEEIREMGMSLDRQIYNSIIDTFGKYGELDEALQVFEKMQRESVRPDITSWNSLILWHCRAGDISKALELFTEMQEQGLHPDPKIFITIISRLGEQGKWDVEDIRNYELQRVQEKRGDICGFG